MASSGPVQNLKNVASLKNWSFEGILAKAVFIPIVQFFVKSAEAIGALMDVFIVPVSTFVGALGDIINAIIGGAASLIGAGATAGATSLTEGLWANFGPFAFPLAIGVALLAAYMLTQYSEIPVTSDTIPFSMTDFPLIGTDEDEQ